MSIRPSIDRSSEHATSRRVAWSLAAALGLLYFAAESAKAEDVEDWNTMAVVGIFPRGPLRSLSISVTVNTNYGSGPAWENVCTPLVEGATLTYTWPGMFEVEFPPSSRYRQSQAVLACDYYTHEPNLGMSFDFYLVEAINVDGNNVIRNTAMCLTQLDYDNPSLTLDSRWLCGDADDDGSVEVSDALAVLRAAVGVASCVNARCDADGNGSTAPTDALRVLQFTVGRDVSLLCSSCDP
jgi:hypothetical protein